jgi:hypothetical protein
MAHRRRAGNETVVASAMRHFAALSFSPVPLFLAHADRDLR